MPEIIRRSGIGEEFRGVRYSGRLSGEEKREVKEINRAVRRQEGRGLVIAARLNAGAHATRAGLVNTGMLSKDEEMLIQFAPLADARLKAICDAYAIYAAGEVGRL